LYLPQKESASPACLNAWMSRTSNRQQISRIGLLECRARLFEFDRSTSSAVKVAARVKFSSSVMSFSLAIRQSGA